MAKLNKKTLTFALLVMEKSYQLWEKGHNLEAAKAQLIKLLEGNDAKANNK